MFFSGDLSSGLTKAVREHKLVACFITDEGEESWRWENEFLPDPELQTILKHHVVLLRLIAGSSEASYLAAIVPLPKSPTFAIIDNGSLKEYIVPKVSQQEFKDRILIVLPSSQRAQSAQAREGLPAPGVRNQDMHSEHAVELQSPPSGTIPSTNPITPTPSPAVQALLAERAARLDAEKKVKNNEERERRRTELQAQKEAADASNTNVTRSEEAEAAHKYAKAQKKRRDDARAERARILRLVEDDKIARKERSVALRSQVAEGQPPAPFTDLPRVRGEVAIQVRLFDGSTMRSSFPSYGTLRSHLRPQILQSQKSDVPYTFKRVLNPLPNKDITMSEEEQTFAQLELLPSATFILIPVSSYTNAYQQTSYVGLIISYISAFILLLASGLARLRQGLSSTIGIAGIPTSQEASQIELKNAELRHPRTNTLPDHRRDDEQFYNGNALNFEPHKNDDEPPKD